MNSGVARDYPQGAAKSVHSGNSIAGAIDTASSLATEINMLCEELRNQLNAVLVPQPPTTERTIANAEPSAQVSAVTDGIMGITRTLRATRSTLQDIQARYNGG